jgi:integrase
MKYPVSSDEAYWFSDDQDKFNVRKMIRSRTNKQGLTKVIVEVQHYTYGGTGDYHMQIKRVSTDVWINPKNWNQKKEEISKSEPDAESKNNTIEKKYAAVKLFISSKGMQRPDQVYGEGVDLSKLADFFPARTENRKCLVDYIDDYIIFRKSRNTKRTTLKEFTTMKNRVTAFDKYKGSKTYLEDIDIEWSDDFELWLRNNAKNRKTIGYGEGTIEKTYTILITVLNHFYNRRKKNPINLSDDFKIQGKSGNNGFKRGDKSVNEPNPLSKAQLLKLYRTDFEEPHLQKIKDRFIWQCYTGLRYVDAFAITKAHIKNGWLKFKPSKTLRYKVNVEQPLNPVAKELLEKYNFDMTKLVITNQAYNRDLKEMFEKLREKYPKLEYKTDYGTYCSRDTFITMAIKGGADWKSILKWVGQSSYQIMSRYYGLEDKHQEQKVKKIFMKPQTIVKRKPSKSNRKIKKTSPEIIKH